jgi:hypothetical protein
VRRAHGYPGTSPHVTFTIVPVAAPARFEPAQHGHLSQSFLHALDGSGIHLYAHVD